MEKSLVRYYLPKFNQDQVNSLNIPIHPKKLEALIKSLLTKKCSVPDSSTIKFYQTFKEELISILPKLFHKIETEGKLQNSSYESTVT